MSRTFTLTELAEVGSCDLGASEWIDVTQERIDKFADATGDHQWIHTDRDAARSGPFGGTVAHGYWTLSLLGKAVLELFRVSDAAMTLNYGSERVRFTNAVPIGSRVRVHAKLTGTEPKGAGQLNRIAVEVEVEDQAKPALVAEVLFLSVGHSKS
jgi:acyl dehydratase